MHSILKENEMLYYNYRDLLGTIQWQLLCAIAKEQKVYAPTSKHFLVTYALGGTSAIRRALDALLKKQIIYREIEPDGKSYYEVYDVFFARWLEKFNY